MGRIELPFNAMDGGYLDCTLHACNGFLLLFGEGNSYDLSTRVWQTLPDISEVISGALWDRIKGSLDLMCELRWDARP